MDKNELVRRFAGANASDEDRLILARVLDKREACERGHVLTNTKFLNEHQRVLAENMLAHNSNGAQHLFYGGYDEAQRAVIIFLPDYISPEQACRDEDSPLVVIRTQYASENTPTHRDFLGSLMGCGIQRDTVGDILPSEESCDLIVLKEISPFVLTNLESAGKAKLKLSVISPDQIHIAQAEFKTVKDTVASLRLDNVVSAGYSISREKAADAIKTGKVTVNHMESLKPDRPMAAGDRITWRGMGKVELIEIGNPTKKGRLPIVIRKF